LIFVSTALELEINNNNIMNNLILDAARNKIFLTFIFDKNIYTCSHENSKINFEKIMILINNFLQKNKFLLSQISNIYVNRGPGSFAGIRNTLSVIKALYLTKNIDYYCFSVDDFLGLNEIKHQDVPDLCKKFNIKKNLIKPIYLS
jgi:tRNA A37 threonylcarbamoyladenosine modification protein TsaB